MPEAKLENADFYLLGHGGYAATGNQVRVLPSVTFYGMPDEVLDKTAGVVMPAAESYGALITPTPHADWVPNYDFSTVTDADGLVPAIRSLMRDSEQHKLHICGVDQNFPDNSRLCGEDSPGCATGHHTCSGLLGRYSGRLKIICCRAPYGGDPAWDKGGPGRTMDVTDDVATMVQRLAESRANEFDNFFTTSQFARSFDGLRQGVQATLYLSGEIREWVDVRAAYWASDFMNDSESLIRYLRTIVDQDYTSFKTMIRNPDFTSRVDYVTVLQAETALSPDVVYEGIFAALYDAAIEQGVFASPTGVPEVDLWQEIKEISDLTRGFTDGIQLEAVLAMYAHHGRTDIVAAVTDDIKLSGALDSHGYHSVLMHLHVANGSDDDVVAVYLNAEDQVRQRLLQKSAFRTKLRSLGVV
ncbi:hypothetical protein ACIQUL_34125 [Streptomyces sp. NPDC090303]|uniref:hypothetical protein n=1 Tax=Streptomyces sp. NPDC090303 TaxID=3365960 RepID=UPI003822E595